MPVFAATSRMLSRSSIMKKTTVAMAGDVKQRMARVSAGLRYAYRMFVYETDFHRLITFALAVGAPLTERELEGRIANFNELARAVDAAGPDATSTCVMLAETENGPNASQRKRIGEAQRQLDRGVQVLVTRSPAIRAIATAIRWFAPANPKLKQQSFATWEEARTWLVANTKHPGAVLDEMHEKVRAKAKQ
jgi:hypothetical protein